MLVLVLARGAGRSAAFPARVFLVLVLGAAARCLVAARSLARLWSAVRPLAGALGRCAAARLRANRWLFQRVSQRKRRRVVATRERGLAFRALQALALSEHCAAAVKEALL